MSEIVESINEVCGVCFRSVFLPKAGMRIPQHAHDKDHPTLCGAGRASLFVEGVFICDVAAGEAVPVSAGKQHLFVALEDGTRLICVWPHGDGTESIIKER